MISKIDASKKKVEQWKSLLFKRAVNSFNRANFWIVSHLRKFALNLSQLTLDGLRQTFFLRHNRFAEHKEIKTRDKKDI